MESCPTKRSPGLLLRDWMDKASTKLPRECESVFHFYIVFHDKLLKSEAERVKAAANTNGATSHLAYNNDNFPPPCPFKTACLCLLMFVLVDVRNVEKNLSLAPISREPTHRKNHYRPPCATEIA